MSAREPVLTPHEIADNLRAAGHISQAQADQLARRIGIWTYAQRTQWHLAGIAEALERVHMTLTACKSAAQKTGVQRAICAIQRLLPKNSEEYRRGFQDGTTAERRKHQPHP